MSKFHFKKDGVLSDEYINQKKEEKRLREEKRIEDKKKREEELVEIRKRQQEYINKFIEEHLDCDKNLIYRFFTKVDIKEEDECWNWLESVDKDGYGRFSYYDRNLHSSKVSLIIHNGKIPKGIYALHKCDNRKCVNPKHLWLGSQQENLEDRDNKGRGNISNFKINVDIATKIREDFLNGLNKRQLFKKYKISSRIIYSVVSNRTWYSYDYQKLLDNIKDSERMK